jgi:hypothetical protein
LTVPANTDVCAVNFLGERPLQIGKQIKYRIRPIAIEEGPVTLVGEGYGGKIQKGSGYQEEQRFILFDVFVEPTEDHPLGIWLEREIVEEIAAALDIPVVPVLFKAPLLDGVDYVKGRPESLIAEDPSLVMEGVVTRPSTELRDRLGRRVITKIKVRDFDETNER